jgi:peptidoglycan/xylan/chitin deacetylase (PgdA/CDA1 family)
MRSALLVLLLATATARAESVVAKTDDKDTAAAEQKVMAKATKAVEKKQLATIKPEPNEFTNDPLLGLAKRVDGEENPGFIAFTFDDGPNPATTPAVLDALKQYDIPTTFFIVTQRLAGKHGERGRELLARELAEGHLVASHSVTHRWLGKATTKTLDKEMDASFKALSTEAKRPIALFRAPFGAMSPAGRARLKKLGVTEVFWSIDTLDWQAKDGEKLRKKVAKMIEKQNGGVILFHDIQPVTAKAIVSILDDLEARNCKALADKREPIWPVTLHYFLKDGKTARAIPDDVAKRTEAYKAALPGRCAKRPPPPADPAPAAETAPAKSAKSASTPAK